ncbi:beta-lactamase [Streptomyces cyaneogriseus subsp. noncyanogenus]|uniref:Beta-lactamase n=1 Tax=Streptomyces cyaneogriseus subsp. noncyanogenus TaxID=477245 RepID=A0A0C5G0Y5_9ACTN|nr:MBL fold metallo-hydrolase [Streptomyces cyaneogriseus]AJP02190.1 beta-lactamase [Streptomyces cyaneogriseus subsp. noncyanogenus]
MNAPPATGPAAALASWTVGDITVHRIDEVPLPPATGPWLLPGATPDVVAEQDWLRPCFADDEGVLRLDSHSFAFTLGGLRVLVDTGIGNGKQRANPAWHGLNTGYLEHLAAAGFPPDSVDLVILTHLHADHVGWNTRRVNGEWIPTFPYARYLTSRAERAFWAAYDREDAREQMFRDSVTPVEEAGLLDLVDVPAEGYRVVPGLRLVPTPGHTPGHLAVELTSRGRTALITGDCVHHPVQLGRPGIGACVDIDPVQAEATRRSLLGSLADTDTLVLGTHFAPPTAGYVITHEDAYRLSPVPARTP